jgi:hypothetical protein
MEEEKKKRKQSEDLIELVSTRKSSRRSRKTSLVTEEQKVDKAKSFKVGIKRLASEAESSK